MTMLTLTSTIDSTAQRSLPTDVRNLIHVGLQTLGCRLGDLSMPPDLTERDNHRTEFHDALFSRPLTAFDVANNIAQALDNAREEGYSRLLDSSMRHLRLGSHRPHALQSRLSGKAIVEKLGVDPQDEFGFVGGTYLMRYLAPIIEARDTTVYAHDVFIRQSILVELCDSLWRMNTEDEHSSLWQLHAAEVRGRERAEEFFMRARPESFTEVYNFGWSLYHAALQVARSSQDVVPLIGDSLKKTTVVRTSIGLVALGGPGPDVYDDSYAVIIDVGGDDVYLSRDTTKAHALELPIRLIVDLAGDDTYLGKDFSYGAAVAGISILIDVTGNDTYRSGSFSLGCGLFGVGILHDLAGNDSYSSATNTQGCGIFGIGLLRDDAGTDTYVAQAQGQGFGATRGLGMLHDAHGNDQYLAASPFQDVLRYEDHQTTFTQGVALGYRPIASGGIGILVDGSGNDLYSCDIYGQGAAYWFGLGAVVDMSGSDRYQAYQYAQGSGVHLATGLVVDESGDDIYVSHGVSQGCGHDYALGSLVDLSGNDSYIVESLSLGGGNANAASIFVDVAGNDSYVAMNSTNTLGYSDFRRTQGMIGLFLDGSGDDRYGESLRNGTTTVKSTYGAFVDVAGTTSVSTTAATTSGPQAGGLEPLRSTVDELFIQASAAPLRFQPNVQPARDRLVSMGEIALAALAAHMATKMPRERLTLEYVLPKIHASSPAAVESLLTDRLRSADNAVVTLAATVCGKIRAPSMVRAVTELSTQDSWKRRRLAALTLGEIGDASAMPTLRKLLSDNHPWVRARAAYAIGIIGGVTEISSFRKLFMDTAAIVRNAACEGLVLGTLRNDSVAADASEIASFVQSLPETPRGATYRALTLVPSARAQRLTEAFLVNENNESLRQILLGMSRPSPSAPSINTTDAPSQKQKKKSKKKSSRSDS